MRNCPMNESTHCSFDIFTNSWDLAIQTERLGILVSALQQSWLHRNCLTLGQTYHIAKIIEYG